MRILAAKQDLAIGDTITADNAHLVPWPAASVPAGALTEAQAQAFLAKNNAAVRSLVAGEPILQSRTSARAGLAANIPANQRAVSIPINAVTGVSGFVIPGDLVDVVLTRPIPGSNATADDQMATTILQNVAVLAIDARASDRPEDKPDNPKDAAEVPELKTATLMVDALGAQKLALGTQVGKLTLVLRNASDRTPDAALTMMPRDLGGVVRVAQRSTRPAANGRPASIKRVAARPEPAALPRPIPTMVVVRGTQESVEGVFANGY